MGIHLTMYRVNGVWLNEHEDVELDLHEVGEHDSLRYVGDREFNNSVHKTYHPDDEDLWRPKSIEGAMQLILAIAPKNRLVSSLKLLEEHEDYWFKTSY